MHVFLEGEPGKKPIVWRLTTKRRRRKKFTRGVAKKKVGREKRGGGVFCSPKNSGKTKEKMKRCQGRENGPVTVKITLERGRKVGPPLILGWVRVPPPQVFKRKKMFLSKGSPGKSETKSGQNFKRNSLLLGGGGESTKD